MDSNVFASFSYDKKLNGRKHSSTGVKEESSDRSCISTTEKDPVKTEIPRTKVSQVDRPPELVVCGNDGLNRMDYEVFSSFSCNTDLKRRVHNRTEVKKEENGESYNGTTAKDPVKTETDVEDCRFLPAEVCGSPPNWQEIIEKIRSMRINQDAPVDQMGTHQLADKNVDEKTQRFHLLVAAMISSQTRDAVTAAAMMRLRAFPGGLTVDNLSRDEVTVEHLADILKPVGFYRQKAKYLKIIAGKLSSPPYFGSVPCTLDELLKLPGVGPKVALLVLWVAFGKGEEGFIVDTNVRRVCCRLGWAPEGSMPEQVKASLESWVPRRLWPELSFLFVGFGQQVCKPAKPQCDRCTVNSLCPSASNNLENEMFRKKKAKQKK